MSEANVVSLQDAIRNRAAEETPTVSIEELQARQTSLPIERCHVALDRVTFHIKTRKRRYSLFEDLSVAFPKGRKIVVYGHKGSGKTTLANLMIGRLMPLRGRILGGKGLSWPIHQSTYFDARATVKENLVFCARTLLNADPSRVLDMATVFCDLTPEAMVDQLGLLHPLIRRRLGYLIVLMADFDCHLVDSPFKGQAVGFTGTEAEQFEAFGLNRDYIMLLAQPHLTPHNADLAYLLYDGRLYMFEDIFSAIDLFKALPVPDTPDLAKESAGESFDDVRPEEF